ncbi:Bystin [Taenia crassiceps]|uniref:Bystin n=1 Tax=Taenia crassiceps TaxID=6207 RepID=A0ABR4QAD7_9CEST
MVLFLQQGQLTPLLAHVFTTIRSTLSRLPCQRLEAKGGVRSWIVLDERSVKRLHKLLKQSNEENNLLPKRKKVEKLSLDDDESSAEDVDIIGEGPPLQDDDGDEYNEEWEKFYKPNADDDGAYSKELIQNINEAKSVVAEEMSEYCGSLPDLGDFKAVDDFEELPDELKKHIRLLKDVLSHYRSGPLPKTIKVLPHLPGYESLLEMLAPLDWTSHAYPRVVKVFASKGGDQAFHFYENYLLPKVRDDIAKNGRLCVHLFEALIASLFRIREFLAAIFYPWIKSEMTKTEGVVLAHLIKKASIRAHFSAVALSLTCEEEFSIPRSMVIEAIISKRYFLPVDAVARLVAYFTSFEKANCSMYFTPEGRMPLTWFKSLLAFLEFYREGVRPEEREKLPYETFSKTLEGQEVLSLALDQSTSTSGAFPEHPLYDWALEHCAEKSDGLDDFHLSGKLVALRQLLIDCGFGDSRGSGSSSAGDGNGGGGCPTEDAISIAEAEEQGDLLGQHRALIFFQTKRMLSLVTRLLNTEFKSLVHLRLDGSVSLSAREALVSRFNADPSIDALLLTTAVGSLGLKSDETRWEPLPRPSGRKSLPFGLRLPSSHCMQH